MAEKSRYWAAICYPDNMRKDWEEVIDQQLEFPFAYCVHNMDHDSKSEQRKNHVHIMLVWSNTTTKKAALEIFDRLSAPGCRCCSTVQSIHNIRAAYDYLIHDTEAARKAGKELYPESVRIEGNNFDIGMFEQLSSEEKGEAAKEICKFVIDRNIQSLSDVFIIVTESEDFKDAKYWEAFRLYSSMIDRICKSLYLKEQAKKKKD